MKKVFHFEAPRENYHCDAAILWCFDQPLRPGVSQVPQAHIGVVEFRPHRKAAGGAKCLASPERESRP